MPARDMVMVVGVDSQPGGAELSMASPKAAMGIWMERHSVACAQKNGGWGEWVPNASSSGEDGGHSGTADESADEFGSGTNDDDDGGDLIWYEGDPI